MINSGISIAILAKNERRNLEQSLPRILDQKGHAAAELLVVDSGSTDGTVEVVRSFGERDRRVRLLEITPESFHHARTRNEAVSAIAGRYVVFLGGDAIPMNDDWLASLVRPVLEGRVMAAYGRQVPLANADAANRCRIQFNYGLESLVKSADGRLSTKDRYFFSTVSCCVDRERVAEPFFDESFSVNEDATLACRIIDGGGKIAYCASSVVLHSHNYSLGQMFQRAFDNGVVYRKLGIFSPSDESIRQDGLRYVGEGMRRLARDGLVAQARFFAFFVVSGLGLQLGIHHQRLPRGVRRVLSKYGTA